jgi:hypothetical protein
MQFRKFPVIKWMPAVAMFAGSAGAAIGAEAAGYRKVLAEKGPALVTVKFLLKANMGPMMGGEHEQETEVTGVMIDAKGLALCSNTQLGGFVAMMKRMMGPMMGEASAAPTDLKVLVGDDTEGKEAELLARDTELDLAWVRIKEPGDKPYEFVDLSKGVTPEVGTAVIVLRRMGKYFARAAVASDAHIGGIVSKPRNLYVPTMGAAGAMGVPVFTAEGQFVGLTILQVPENGDAEPNPMAMLGGMMSGMQDMMTGMILPAADVAKATSRALENAGKK